MGNNKVIYTGKLTVRYSMHDFIKAVRERPILWDRKHPQFHMRDRREIAWHEVSNKVSDEFATATTEEKNKMVDTLVKRWKNTRDCFLRSYRSQENNDKDSRECSTRRYIYDNELKFLLNTNIQSSNRRSKRKAKNLPTRSRLVKKNAKKSHYDSNMHNDFDTEYDTLCLEVGEIVNLDEHLKTETMNGNNELSIKASNSTSIIERNIQEADKTSGYLDTDESVPIIKSNQSMNGQIIIPNETVDKNNPEPYLNPDADQSFFDSIKPIMHTLSVDVKLDFQIEVLKLLKHFRNKEMSC